MMVNISVSTLGSSSSLLSLCRALARNNSSSSLFIDDRKDKAAAKSRGGLKSTTKTKDGNKYCRISSHRSTTAAATSATMDSNKKTNATWPILVGNNVNNKNCNIFNMFTLESNINNNINQLQSLQQQMINCKALQNMLSATTATDGLSSSFTTSNYHPFLSSAASSLLLPSSLGLSSVYLPTYCPTTGFSFWLWNLN